MLWIIIISIILGAMGYIFFQYGFTINKNSPINSNLSVANSHINGNEKKYLIKEKHVIVKNFTSLSHLVEEFCKEYGNRFTKIQRNIFCDFLIYTALYETTPAIFNNIPFPNKTSDESDESDDEEEEKDGEENLDNSTDASILDLCECVSESVISFLSDYIPKQYSHNEHPSHCYGIASVLNHFLSFLTDQKVISIDKDSQLNKAILITKQAMNELPHCANLIKHLPGPRAYAIKLLVTPGSFILRRGQAHAQTEAEEYLKTRYSKYKNTYELDFSSIIKSIDPETKISATYNGDIRITRVDENQIIVQKCIINEKDVTHICEDLTEYTVLLEPFIIKHCVKGMILHGTLILLNTGDSIIIDVEPILPSWVN